MPNLVKRTGRKLEYDALELKKYATTLENRADVQARVRIHEEDESYWRLDKYVLEELNKNGLSNINKSDWPAFTSNDPRTYWNAIRRSVTSEKPRVRIELPEVTDVDQFRELQSAIDDRTRHERFIMGMWQDIDEWRLLSAKLGFQDAAAWHMCIRGGIAVRCWLDPKKEHQFRPAIWDLKTTSWDVGADGLEGVVHHYRDDFYSIQNRYPDECKEVVPDAIGKVEVYDIWWMEHGKKGDQVWNCMLVNGHPVIPPTHHDDLTRIPVIIVKTFTPDFEYAMDTHDVGYQWESIYTANKEIYRWMNRVGTLYGLYLRNNAIGPYVSDIPNATEKDLANALRPFNIIKSNIPGRGIHPVSPPNMAGEAKEFFSWLQGASQRGSVPYSVYGQIPFELSGFAVNQLQGAVSIVAGQVSKQLEEVYRMCTDEFIRQFKKKGTSVTVHGQDNRRRRYIEEFKRSEIREKYYLEVEIKPELPVDKLQEAQVATSWRQLGVSPVTIYDQVLGLPDPVSEMYKTIGWQKLEAEIAAKTQGITVTSNKGDDNGGGENNEPREPMPSASVISPETLGRLDQHRNFQPTPQNMPMDIPL